MSKLSTVTISAIVSGDGVNDSYGVTTPIQIVNQTAPSGIPVPVALSTGNNTLTGPSGAIAALVVPPAGSTVTKILKGATGDTGVTMASALPFIVSAASFILNASAGETVFVAWV